MMYLSPFTFANPRRAIEQLFGRPYRAVHEIPVDHLPPLEGATVTRLADRRRQRHAIGMHGTRSGS